MIRKRCFLDSAEHVAFTTITDEKFKKSVFQVYMTYPFNEENTSAYGMLSYILDGTNEDYPDMTSFSSKLAELYGASLGVSDSRFGDYRCTEFRTSCISDKYALEGEKLTLEIIKLLCGCIFRPATENGVFPEKLFKLRLMEMINDINGVINDKRSYALLNARKRTYVGENSSIRLKGTAEQAEKLTPGIVYKAYQQMLATAHIEIFYGGNPLSEECEEYIRSVFTRDVQLPEFNYFSPSPIKSEVCEASDTLDITQSKMVMAFKFARYENVEAAEKLFLKMFCSAPFSLLYKNVREKMSLCYYCSCSGNVFKNVVTIDSGLDASKIDTARAEIMHQLKIIQDGEFEDDLLEQVRIIELNQLKAYYDFPSSLVGWYSDRYMIENTPSPKEYSEIIKAVTKEDIMKFAKSLVLDTVYVLKGKE